MRTTEHARPGAGHDVDGVGTVGGRRRAMALWGFPALYLGWAYAWWWPILGSDTSVWSGTNLVLFLVGGASPLLAGIATSWVTSGRAALRDLWTRLVDVRRVPARVWPLLLVFWLGFYLLQGGAAVVLGITDRPFAVATDVLVDPAALGFLLLLSFGFPAVEEVGLRGHWLDHLLARFRPGVAATVNGATWALWHVPFVLFPGYYANTTFDPDLSWWVPMIICDTVLYVWVYTHTRRSVLAVLVFHAMMNLTGELLGISADMYPFVLWFYLAAAGLVLVRWRRS